VSRTLFVDFLYAIVVSLVFSRITVEMLSWSSIEMWAILLLLYIFIEDFYIYHRIVRPFLKEGPPSAKSLLLEVGIVFSWFLSETAFPRKPATFAAFLAVFYALKLAGGFKMADRQYPGRRDTAFVVPIVVGVVFAILGAAASTTLYAMAGACILASVLWWKLLAPLESR
jgi:hypothetical protein